MPEEKKTEPFYVSDVPIKSTTENFDWTITSPENAGDWLIFVYKGKLRTPEFRQELLELVRKHYERSEPTS